MISAKLRRSVKYVNYVNYVLALLKLQHLFALLRAFLVLWSQTNPLNFLLTFQLNVIYVNIVVSSNLAPFINP